VDKFVTGSAGLYRDRRYGFFLSRRFRWREHNNKSVGGLVFFSEGGRGMDSDKKATKVWRLKIEVFGLKIER